MGKKIIINESQFDIIDKWDKLILTYSGLDNPFILFENNNSTLCEGYYSTFTKTTDRKPTHFSCGMNIRY